MNDLSNELIHEIIAALLIVPTSKVNGVSFDKIAKGLGELLAYREAQGKAVAWRDKKTGWCGTVAIQGSNPSDKGYEPLFTAPQLPAVPDGWALVPLEATPEMLGASWVHHSIHAPNAWRTMVAAARSQKSET